MNQDFAWKMLVNAMKSGSMLSAIAPELKANCTEQEYAIYRKAIGGIAGTISEELISPIFTQFPEFRTRMEAILAEHGQL